jgi:hypothetical protein
MRKLSRLKVSWCLALTAVLGLPVPSMAGELARMDIASSSVHWDVQGDAESVVLSVSLPNGQVVRREMASGAVRFELDAAALDGAYIYELRATPRIDAATKRELRAARRSGQETAVIERLRAAGKLPREEALVQSGTFTVRNGAIVSPDSTGEGSGPRQRTGKQIITAATQVIPEDLVVQGSECVGIDCTATESFGFDTIRLKENNLRIKFEDTSSSTGYPSTDWQLTANDSAGGGANKFSIEDITAATVPFTVTGGAPNNSIFVDSSGRVGIRTAAPGLELQVTDGDTAGVRLEQPNTGGFTAQTWDVAGNEANFFVRDLTGGSLLPFRIRPGAPTSSIDIASSGKVGVGTASPTEKLHVTGSNGDNQILVAETNGTAATRTMFQMSNNGGVRAEWIDTSLGVTWGANLVGGNFNILQAGAGLTAFSLTGAGVLTVVDLIESSDRDMKTDVVAVQPEEILTKVSRLPLATWRFKNGTSTHLGPMAQDFSAAFGLGPDDKHIKALDVASVSLAAVQALHKQVTEKDAAISELRQRNDELAARLAQLETLVSALAADSK